MSIILLTLLVTTCYQACGANVGALDSGVEGITPTNERTEDANTSETCTTSSGAKGVCVIYYNCEHMVQDDLESVIDIHYPYEHTPCKSYLDVCCIEKLEESTPHPVDDNQKNGIKTNGCGYRNVNGVRFNPSSDLQDRSNFGEFPWTVAILRVESTADAKPEEHNLVYLGGGSLLHPRVVLTAAHVVRTDNKLLVRAGEWDIENTKEIYAHQEREVETTVTHKDFTKKLLNNDVSLLFLKSPMELAPNVGLACLPPQDQHTTHGQRCLVTGWKKDQFGDVGRYATIQKKMDVTVVDHGTCEKLLQKTRIGKRFRLHESFMCASGSGGKKTCVAAGGSPLLCPHETYNDRYILNGMVAWNIGCGGNEIPEVYVDVSSHRSWIDEEIAKKGFNNQMYNISVEY